MKNQWFTKRGCTSLEVKQHKSISQPEVVTSVTLKDSAAIGKLMERIEKLPVDGPMMKSFGPDAEHVALSFTCGRDVQTIDVYNKRFKTPSTGFNTDSKELEDALYADLDALLYPELGKLMPLVVNLELRFKTFSITYKGQSTYTPSEQESVSFTRALFSVRDNTGVEQEVTATSGQLPPKPVELTVNKVKLTLLTYETKKGARLYPHYFQVTK